MGKTKLEQPNDEVDLTPMIDMIFLLIIFFILAGKITSDLRSEQITVPPTKTAQKIEIPDDWRHVIVDVFGTTQTAAAGHGHHGPAQGWSKRGLEPTWSE